MTRTLLIDDLRGFRDIRPATIIRTSEQAIAYLQAHEHEHFDEIWFDHDLGEATGAIDTILPVVDYMSERSFFDNPVKVGICYIHTSNPRGRLDLQAAFDRFGYNYRVVDSNIELHQVVFPEG